ncbi:L-aminoadipate-semialdehyde dehydrogenase [Xylaria sp. FL1042]|nr:L-aminoadipate-semialdehyde dehydrogenase [Xylaria sp. FL1042]
MPASKDYGRRLVVTIVDDMARDEPDRIVYSLPLTRNVADGFRDITALELANAVNRTAWWLESELGKGSSFPTVGYIGPHNDFRYILLILSCVKAGYKALLPSPRNNTEATVAILNRSNCDIWVTPQERPEALSSFLAARPMKVVVIPETSKLLDSELVPIYPYNKTFKEAASDPFCVLHTSGSTGLPKPIIWKNSLVATVDAYRLLPAAESAGRPPWTSVFNEHDRFYSAFPLYHGAGLIMNILIRAFYGTSNVISPQGVLSTINVIDSLLDFADITTWSIMPSIIDEIGETPSISVKFKDSKCIIASGGPVTFGSAEKAAEVVRIINLTGTTESMFQGMVLVDATDWIYFSFHPRAGFQFKKLEDGIYEHWAFRNDENVDLFQGVFHTFPDINELCYKDLYEPHPTKPDMWLYRGRTDELLVMSNGEKIRPLAMEAIINSHPEVSACLMIGTGYTMPSLLIELANPEPSSVAEREMLLDRILEKVHAANAIGSQHSRIFREYIWFAKPDKPFARTDKRTVKRRDTVLLYNDEIIQFYKDIEESGSLNADIDFSSRATISQGLRRLLVAANVAAADQIQGDDDLLHAGVDSLAASSIANSLRSALRKRDIVVEGDKFALTPKFIYTHPTINALTEALFGVAQKTVTNSDNSVDLQSKIMDEFLTKYAAGRSRPRNVSINAAHGYTIILTGSTGSLGSYLLDSLLQQPQRIKKIYCLNRAEDGKIKQKSQSELRGLNTNWSTDKVEFLQVDLSKQNFGLDQEAYGSLLQQTTHIIHNQWPVNYNWDIASFEPQIRGVRNLIDFAHASTYNASLFFVSSVATVSHLRPDGTVPEAPNHRYHDTADGYAASKHVAELLLEKEATNSGLRASICRVGQISGPVLRGNDKGMWPKHEWLPTLIASSKYLGVLPSSLGPMSRVDWIPVDLLSEILVQLAVRDNQEGGAMQVYHAVNPKAIDWGVLAPSVARRLGGSIKIVSWAEWVESLRNSARGGMTTASLKQNPALKLLDYFESVTRTAAKGESWPVLETEETAKKSRVLAELLPVSEQWLDLWLQQWRF